MAFLDNLDRKITSLGQGVAQKSKEVTDSVKISAALKTAGIRKKMLSSSLEECITS